jgi:hypothetical protein
MTIQGTDEKSSNPAVKTDEGSQENKEAGSEENLGPERLAERFADSRGEEQPKDWMSSASRQRARARRFKVVLPGLLLLYAGILGLTQQENLIGATSAANSDALVTVAGTAIVIGMALLFYGAYQYQNARAAFYELAEKQARGRFVEALDQISDVNDLVGFMRANRKQMDAYDAIARRQAATSYKASHVAMGLGLFILSVGIGVAIFSTEDSTKYAAAFLTAVGAVIGGYVSRTYITVQKHAMLQMNYYFQQPLVQSYLLTAERLAHQLDEPNRTQALSGVIARIVDKLLLASNGELRAGDGMPTRHARGTVPEP